MHIHYSGFSTIVKYDAREENKTAQIFSTRLTRNTARNMGREGGRQKGRRKKYCSSTETSQQESNQFNSISSKSSKKWAELSAQNNSHRVNLFLSSSA